MKLVLKIFSGLVVLVVIVIGATFYYLDNIIREAVVRIGPEVTGTSVELASVDLSILSGNAALSGLAIGNPEGFEKPNIFSLESVAVDIDLASLNTDVIIINRIYIDSPEIAYEGTESGDNFQALLDNIAENMGAASESDEETSGTAKKIIIDEFVLAGGLVSAKHQFLQGKTIDVLLPDLILTDIGRKTNGATAQEAASQILKQITSAATSALTNSALIQQAKQEIEALKQEAQEKVEAKIDEALEEQLEGTGLGAQEQDALKGLIKGFGR